MTDIRKCSMVVEEDVGGGYMVLGFKKAKSFSGIA